MKTDKKNKQQFIDDGRVIASMDIDGVPGAVFRRPKIAVDSGRSIDKKDPITLTGREKLAAAGNLGFLSVDRVGCVWRIGLVYSVLHQGLVSLIGSCFLSIYIYLG